MCTIFTEMKDQPKWLAKNYDCLVDQGMIFTNRRGMKKVSLVMPPEKPFYWQAIYGSVTFSQSGKGMPSSGINEKGLIVEQATCPTTSYPKGNDRPTISCLEATQYLLDTCSNVAQSISAYDDFYMSQMSGKIHFFLMDRQGDSAIVEFLDGQMTIYRSPVDCPLVTNSEYKALCKGKEQFVSDYEENSFRRIEIAKKALDQVITINDAFALLKRARRQDTIWSIVYEQDVHQFYFKTQSDQVKVINMDTIDFSETANSLVYDLAEEGDEVVWQPYSREINRRNIEGFYSNPIILKLLQLPDASFVINAFDEHIERIEKGL